MTEDNRIPFELQTANQDVGCTFELDFEPTPEEKHAFPSLEDFEDLHVEESLDGASLVYSLHLAVYGTSRLRDAHDSQRLDRVDFEDEADIVISPNDLDQSDILPDSDGVFDLRPTIISLIYNALPRSYSEVPLPESGDRAISVLTAEDYDALLAEKKAKEKRSPFASLDSLGFPDMEDSH